MFKDVCKINVLLWLVLFISSVLNAQLAPKVAIDYNQQAEQFLKDIKAEKSTTVFQQLLATTTVEVLEKNLDADTKKLAFWVNVYNGYIQIILKDNPNLYKDRGAFFKKKQIPIAGDMLSFQKIEHGIIRKSQWPLGLGVIRKWFPNKLERKLRVDESDYRVHFALNCGAIDCPPVAIYKFERLEEQFTKGTKQYLNKTSTYLQKDQKVSISPLFSWFRGDFGCKKGIKEILKENTIIPNTKNISITYKGYDWTLALDNWTDL